MKNGLAKSVVIVNKPVSSVNDEVLLLATSDGFCSGIYQIGRSDCPQCPGYSPSHSHTKSEKSYHTVSLAVAFPSPTVIDFLKIDTEGYELNILKGIYQERDL